MTRKDYILIAKELSYAVQSVGQDASSDETIEKLITAVGNALQMDNDRFDREKFYIACTGGK